MYEDTFNGTTQSAEVNQGENLHCGVENMMMHLLIVMMNTTHWTKIMYQLSRMKKTRILQLK